MNTLIYILAQDKPDGGGFETMLMMGLILVVMWVVMIRPQQKKQKELKKKIDGLKKGDKVISIGGIHGVINHINVEKNTLSLRVADGQFITFDRKSVATILTDETDSKADVKATEEVKEEEK